MADDNKKRAIIEYWEYPFVPENAPKKHRVMNAVIDAAVDSTDAELQFWDKRRWPSGTQTISIKQITLDD